MSTVKVRDLVPGDRVTLAGESAVFITQAVHPVWPVLHLVIWRLGDGTVSLDALSVDQEVGELDRLADLGERQDRLIDALRGATS